MTPEEKIEALREWAASTYYDESSPTWFAGYACARDEVRNIIDPPKPKWREMVDVDAIATEAISDCRTPLAIVLDCLSRLAHDEPLYAKGALARIVVICEAQVGDGWQADPAAWPMTPNLTTLLVYLTDRNGYGEPRWHDLGNAASAWLRSLTDGGAA